MRVLVTGARGTLGLALAPVLHQAGYEPVLQDVRAVDTTVRCAMDHARQVLGVQPQCNVEQWLDELRSRPDERADTSPPWP